MSIHKVSYRKFIGLLLGLSFALSIQIAAVTVSAQGKPIYSGVFPLGAAWSVDSQRFVFHPVGSTQPHVQITKPDWLQYDVATQTLSAHTRWPLQPSLTATEQQLFNPAVEPDGRETFIYESPNQRFLVYVIETGDTTLPMAIADRQQGQVFTPPSMGIPNPFSGPDAFNVLWSADSTVFILKFEPVFGGGLVESLMNNYANNLSDISSQQIDVLINNRDFWLMQTYDLTTNGGLVLLNAVEFDPAINDLYSRNARLIVFNPADPDLSQVIETLDGWKVAGASFAPGNENKLLIVNESGLIEYNLMTDTTTVLDPNLVASQAIFSPNGEYVALIDGAIDIITDVFVVAVSTTTCGFPE